MLVKVEEMGSPPSEERGGEVCCFQTTVLISPRICATPTVQTVRLGSTHAQWGQPTSQGLLAGIPAAQCKRGGAHPSRLVDTPQLPPPPLQPANSRRRRRRASRLWCCGAQSGCTPRIARVPQQSTPEGGRGGSTWLARCCPAANPSPAPAQGEELRPAGQTSPGERGGGEGRGSVHTHSGGMQRPLFSARPSTAAPQLQATGSSWRVVSTPHKPAEVIGGGRPKSGRSVANFRH